MQETKADTISGTDVLQAPQTNGETETLQAPPEVKQPALKLTERESRIFLLQNDKRQGSVHLDLEEDVYDPETKRVRRMRLLRGAQSIWFDEQPPTVYPKEYVNKNILMVEFVKGRCVIPLRDSLKLKAMDLTHRNIKVQKQLGTNAHPKDIYFYEWDPIEQNKKAIEEENDVIKAMQLAMTVPSEEMVPHAQYLNIQFVDEEGVPLDEGPLRSAYIRVAKNNAKKFLDSIHSPTVKIAHMVRKAIDGGKIDLGKQRGAAYWVDGGFISTLPEGRDAVAYLIEFAMLHGEANTAFVNQLRTLTAT